jgi:hypothetical protein
MALHISPSPVKGSSSMSATSGAIPGAWSTKGTTPLLQPRSSQSQSWCPEDERLIDTTPAIGISTAWGREDVLFITQEQRMMMSAALRSALSVTDSLLDALWNARNSGCQLSRSTHEHNGTHQLLAALDAKRELFEGTDVFPESCERAQELRRSVSNFSLSLSLPPSLHPSLPPSLVKKSVLVGRLLVSVVTMLCRYTQQQLTQEQYQRDKSTLGAASSKESIASALVQSLSPRQKSARFQDLWSAIDDLDMTYRSLPSCPPSTLLFSPSPCLSRSCTRKFVRIPTHIRACALSLSHTYTHRHAARLGAAQEMHDKISRKIRFSMCLRL